LYEQGFNSADTPRAAAYSLHSPQTCWTNVWKKNASIAFSAQLRARIELEEKLAREAASNGSGLKEERAELQLGQVTLSMPLPTTEFPLFCHRGFRPRKLGWRKSSDCSLPSLSLNCRRSQ
jgi:hypothetical protein